MLSKRWRGGRISIVLPEGETQVIAVLGVDKIDFDTPHLTEGTAKLPLEHFLKDFDAQEMVHLGQDMKKIREELRTQLEGIQKTWLVQQPIDKEQTRRREATKETFRAPMKQYQDTVEEMSLHVVAQVDAYNRFAAEADKVYVGVKGLLNVGSPLLSGELQQLAPKRFLPAKWYDGIFYEGYRRGYVEGTDMQRLLQAPPASCPTQ